MFDALLTLLDSIDRRQTRAMVVISGDKIASRRCVLQALRIFSQQRESRQAMLRCAWIGEETGDDVADRLRCESRTLLGTDCDSVVFDAWSGFNPDAFGQVCGTLKGGGVLFLLTPDFATWPDLEDSDHLRRTAVRPEPLRFYNHFIRRFLRLLRNAESNVSSELLHMPAIHFAGDAARSFQAVTNLDSVNNRTIAAREGEHASDGLAFFSLSDADQSGAGDTVEPSAEQQIIADQLILQSTTQRSASLLRADRGRGKSVCLGLAVADLLLGLVREETDTTSSKQLI